MKSPKIPQEFKKMKSLKNRKFKKVKNFFEESHQVSQNQAHFAKVLRINEKNFIFMNQPHGSLIRQVFQYDAYDSIQDADGLLTNEKGLFLFVAVADCLPMLFYDPKIKVIGICHAGWKGTIAKIGPKMVKEFSKKFGSNSANLMIGFGPSIGGCCYEVRKDVSGKFKKVFGKDREIIQKRSGKIFIDLRLANYKLLLKTGCEAKNFDVPITCTSCRNEFFYSLRKERKGLGGEISAIIGMKK